MRLRVGYVRTVQPVATGPVAKSLLNETVFNLGKQRPDSPVSSLGRTDPAVIGSC